MYFYILGTLCVYLIGVISLPNWWLVGMLSLGQGIVQFIMAKEHLLSHAYAGYIIFGTFYHVLATVA